MKHLPNIITFARIVCVPFFVVVLMDRDFYAAFYLMCIMSISDGVDGFLAKRFNWQSKLGEYMDPIADKFLLISAFALLYHLSILPLWLVAIILGRDTLIVAGTIILRFLYGETDFRPHWTGKVSTFLQFILIVFALIAQINPLPDIIIPFLINCVAVTAVVSSIVYGAIGWNMRLSANRQYNL